MPRSRHELALLLPVVALTVACPKDTSIFDDQTPPTATLDFPFDGALASGPALTFRGTAQDPSGVTSVTVDFAETSTTDGYATWEVSLEIPTGDLFVQVGTRDQFNYDPQAVTINMERQGELVGPTALDFNPSTGQLVFTDVELEGLSGLVPSEAITQNLSAPNIGQGPELAGCTGVAVDGVSGTAYVVDSIAPALVAVNLSAGTRTVLSDGATGAGTAFSSPVDVALDATGARLLVTDDGLDAVIAVDLATGDRSVFSDGVTGTGAALTSPAGVAIDSVGGALYVADRAGSVVQVDLTTGDRTTVSGGGTGAGPAFSAPTYLNLDLTMDRLFVSDLGLGAILEVNLTSGDRVEVSGPGAGAGDLFDQLEDLWLDEAMGRLLVLDSDAPAVWSVDLATGDRTIFYEFRRGAGDRDVTLDAVTAAPVGADAIYAVARGEAAILRLATPSGDRTVLSDASTGAGPALVEPTDARSLAPGGAAGLDGQLLVVDRGLAALLSVDPATGDRTVLSAGGTGTGAAFVDPAGVAVDSTGAIAWVTDLGADTVVEVDLATGNRTTISGGGAGAGPAFDAPVRALQDPGDPGRLLVMDRGLLAVVAVQLTAGPGAGDRTVLSDGATGAGDPFLSLAGASMTAAGLLVCDPTAGELVLVDLASGDRTLAAGGAVGFGPRLDAPSGLAARTGGDGLYLVTDGATFLVEPTAGDRVVLSL